MKKDFLNFSCLKQMLLSLVALSLMTTSASATYMTLKFFGEGPGSEKKIKIIKMDGFDVSEDCKLKNNAKNKAKKDPKGFVGKTIPQCQALVKAMEKPPEDFKPGSLPHPATAYCKSKGGKELILIDSENRQYDFCRFDDESMVDAWSMYFHHFPPQTAR
ncbi:MAG: DUF333 domain-containing protein [Proteobacteria bacterium]|jgi:putative hemolysin|nr:DUF333 domain-containing protein [Pseudomonadota bacterium]